jgi:hypothetical protein
MGQSDTYHRQRPAREPPVMTPGLAAYHAQRFFRTEQRDGWTVVLCGSCAIARAPAARGDDLFRNIVAAEACAMLDEEFDRRRVPWALMHGTVVERVERAMRVAGGAPLANRN